MNIILLISDTFRYDNLRGRAAMPVRTPELDGFSARAVSLERLYTGSFPTIPQRTDMTSGRTCWPWHRWQARAASTANHMPLLLAQAGYVSQLICDCPHLFPAGFQSGFSAAIALRGQEGDVNFLRMNRPIRSVMPPEKTRYGKHLLGSNLPDLSRWINPDWGREGQCFPPRTAELAVQWLEENCNYHPFFLWVDFFDPHEPWDPPEYMVRRYDPTYTGTPMIHPNYGKAGDYTPEELRNLRAHYCAEAELVDRWVGRVLRKIDDLDLWKNSLVIFTTDHGMSLGEHNRTGKSNINKGDPRFWPTYPEIAHIPCLIAGPGLPAGRAVDAFVQPMDLLPTILDLAGVTVQPPEPFHGRSFAELARGKRARWERDFVVTAAHLRKKEDGRIPPKAVTPMIYTRKWACAPIGAEGAPELFDLETDPLAERNLAARRPKLVKELRAKLIGWLKEIGSPAEAISALK